MNFTLPMCPPLNSLYRHGRRGVYKIAKAREWENEVLFMVMGKYRGYGKDKHLLGNIKMDMVMYLKRDRDIDSSLKLVLDVFEKAGVYENDKQVVDLHVIKAMDKGNPRIEISITKLTTKE
jgi:Holliday junction resolvase RusA-like endonuclease